MLGRREEITPQSHWKQFHLIKTRFTHTEAARAEADFLAHAIPDVHWAGNPGQKHAITISSAHMGSLSSNFDSENFY